jgi:hypothetical protein
MSSSRLRQWRSRRDNKGYFEAQAEAAPKQIESGEVIDVETVVGEATDSYERRPTAFTSRPATLNQPGPRTFPPGGLARSSTA